ncbi:hypothetical protein [Kosakonia sacchari]|uniref:Uncharacterized protein n=1 Tax=Kosakonia sacchari TaxID=1158459 RepID=A0ABZ0MMN2_9ENTR|nr:hypothetical protein [Kosakonia sacchari]WOZ76065.1 hypothetical protein Q8Y70_15825 [Kosakonia sacchari]
MSESNDINIKSASRRLKLEEVKEALPLSVYEKLSYLLEEKNILEFDRLFNRRLPLRSPSSESYISSFASSSPNPESESYEIKISELEFKLEKARSAYESQHKITSSLEKDFIIASKKIEELSSQIKEKEAANVELWKQNHNLQSKIQQNKIDEKVPEYVKGVKAKLQQDDKDFTKMSLVWAISGIVFALFAIIAAFLTFFFKLDIKGTTLTELFYYYTRGLLGVALLSWLSYFCLTNSKKYTHEAIIRKDRQHALMFGEVFLQIYGSTATKQDAIDVFKDWNMSANSAFADKTQQPPSLFNMLGSLLNKKSAANDDKVSEK